MGWNKVLLLLLFNWNLNLSITGLSVARDCLVSPSLNKVDLLLIHMLFWFLLSWNQVRISGHHESWRLLKG